MRRFMLPTVLLAASAPFASAQSTVTVEPRARTFAYTSTDDRDRPMLGISTASSGKRDTLGLLIESVTPGSPADKAGLEEGNRIASINGVSLKLAREDAGESDMSGTMTNRLIREMRKLKAGDEATLEVWTGAARAKTVKVKTVAAEDLTERRVSRADVEDRAALGISLGESGSKRDTLGVFISDVTEGGPAEKAGIVEGERIASVNGVDLRVPKEDIGEWSVSNARVARLQREIRKLKPGQSVDLSVVEGGRARSVKVTLGRAGDLERNAFNFSTGDGGSFMTMPRTRMAPMSPMEPMAPMPPMPPGAPRARVRVYDDGDHDMNFDSLRESLRDLGPRIREEMDRELPRIREDLDRELPRAMDGVREEMGRLRLELPMLRARSGRGVII
jgi:serine protease Do